MAASREAIVEAAGAQFARFGYEATSFSRVAEAMGRPRSAVGYHLFPSKLSLASAVITTEQAHWADLASASTDPAGVERLTRVLLTTALETRTRPGTAGAVRLLRELLHTDVAVPRGFVWADFVRAQLQAAPRSTALPLPEHAEDLVLEATFGLTTAARPSSDDELVRRLHALWVPLLVSFGIDDAADRVAPAPLVLAQS